MNQINLQFTASEQDLVNNSGRKLFASDSVAYVTASFTLGTNWTGGYDLIRAVWKSKSHVIATEIDNNGACVVPQEVLSEKGEVMVNLVGSDLDDETLIDRLTTYAVSALSVVQKVRIDGDADAALTPSIVEQIVARVKTDAQDAETAAETATGAASSAASSATSAGASASTATTKASEAATSATNAAASASAAASSESNASQSATAAAGSATSAESSATNAAASASTASTSASAAATSANNAEASKTAAQSAKTDAEAAKTAAESAASAAAISETNAGNSASSAAESADIATRAAEKYYEKVYGARWDRTTNLLTRLYGAEDITTDTSAFKHAGTFNTNINNPFDLLYPWSGMVVCNVDLVAYRARTGNEPLTSFITAIYGDPDFTYEGTADRFVGRYRPQFWYKSEEDSLGRVTFLISTTERTGYKYAEEAIDGISFAIDAGLNASNQRVITCGTGLPLTDVAGSTLHQYAKNSGFTLQDIDAVDAQTCLFFVEYANMNCQSAIGNGCHDCYRENDADVISNVDNTGSVTVFEVTDSALSSTVFKGSQVDFGTSKGARTYKAVITSFTVESGKYTITLDRLLTNLADGMYMSVHGFDACEFPLVGSSVGSGSGYIGTNGKANAWYRGCVMYANRYQYILGMYRQTGTNRLWICPEGVDPDDYDGLNTSVHMDTGTALPLLGSTGAWQQVGGNAQRIQGLAAFMATGLSSGNSSSPVGDMQYVPTDDTGNTVLWLGCNSGYGTYCGVLGCNWDSSAGHSHWGCAARPLLKKSL